MSYLKGETLSKSRKKNNNAKFLFSIISGIQKMQKKKKKNDNPLDFSVFS